MKLIDFGEAKRLIDEKDDLEKNLQPPEESRSDIDEGHVSYLPHERHGTFTGTLNYIAPEMFTHSKASLATDLWAFGCILFKMVTGKAPFQGRDFLTVKPKVLECKIDQPE